ncbi:MAG: Pyridoxamine 5'-phosphate oxidase [Bacteroidetes bacterium]|nr:Pyridoxamine 5'-phosphate oxidase [Bacteroidota bacterium]
MDVNPVVQFRYWLNEAIRAEASEPNAMVLSTSTINGRPSSRVVLLKNLDGEGFTFFTNFESRKGVEISNNPFGSLLFFWPVLERQVRIEGKIFRTPDHESDEYFKTRPEGSRIGAWASPQSRVVPDREYIEQLHREFTERFRYQGMERPANWGGYKLKPEIIEFWQGRENRLHDRLEYKWKGNQWEISRLAP